MGIGDILGLGSKEVKPKLLLLPEQRQAYQKLLPAATQKGMQFIDIAGQPYGGQFTAPLSSYEQTGLKTLGEYLSSPLPMQSNLFGLTSGELEKTLGGEEYNPATGPYYEAYRTNVARDLQKAIDVIRRRAAGAGGRTVFAGGPVQEEREAMLAGNANIAQILGQLFENERTRRLGAVPLALQTMGWAEQVPQGRVAAAETLGALPRTVEQSDLTAQYQDYLNRLSSLQSLFGGAAGMAGANLPWYEPSYQPSPFSQLMGGLSGGMGGLSSLGGALSGLGSAAGGMGGLSNLSSYLFPQTVKFG